MNHSPDNGEARLCLRLSVVAHFQLTLRRPNARDQYMSVGQPAKRLVEWAAAICTIGIFFFAILDRSERQSQVPDVKLDRAEALDCMEAPPQNRKIKNLTCVGSDHVIGGEKFSVRRK